MFHDRRMSTFAVKWYEYADQGPAWRRLWENLSGYLPVEYPIEFTHEDTANLWANGSYDLTWACGGDVALNPGQFTPLVVPVFKGAPTPPGTYYSRILQRTETLDRPPCDLRIGLNSAASVSGHLTLAHWWYDQEHEAPKEVRITGGHEASVKALLDNQIDMAAIDSQGWHLLLQAYPALETDVHMTARSQILPAPPLCLPGTKAGEAANWREGFAHAGEYLKLGTLDDQGLGLIDFAPVNEQTYARLRSKLTAQLDDGRLLTAIP